MAKDKGRSPRHKKSINLALQGGGSHGAFTWGVLDRMFEEDALWIEGISGTSAGAMNAVVAAQGMYDSGADGARRMLESFWSRISLAGQSSPIQRTPFDILMGSWSLDNSPGYLMMDMLNRLASPYDLNPLSLNPLRDVVKDFVDFDKIAKMEDMSLYISATNVETGRARIFTGQEVTLDALMASACLPQMFKAVEIDGVPYWDGGFMGNPVLLPFVNSSPSPDILIVQINPLMRPGTPRRARDIQNRLNEITFNAPMLRDVRMIELVNDFIRTGQLTKGTSREIYLHMIDGCDDMLVLDASSKLNSEWAFLCHLRDIGRAHADRWLKANFDKIEVESTLDLDAILGEDPKQPKSSNVLELNSGRAAK